MPTDDDATLGIMDQISLLFEGIRQFAMFSRILHWTMAAMVLTMLFIGVAMVASLLDYHLLVSIHRPLGVAILILVVI